MLLHHTKSYHSGSCRLTADKSHQSIVPAASPAAGVGFFDVHATTGMMMQGLNEDTLIIQQAIGEKVGVTIHFLATFVGGYAIGDFPASVACQELSEMSSHATY